MTSTVLFRFLRGFFFCAMVSFPFLTAAEPSLSLYCSAGAVKRKGFFQESGGFFHPARQYRRRAAQQAAALHRRVQPEIPQRAQQRRQRQAVQQSPQSHTRKHVEPQLSLSDAQGEPQQKQALPGDIHRVQRTGKAAVPAAAKPHCAQQVVAHGGGGTQRRGGQVGGQLLGDVVFHVSRTGGTGTTPAAPPYPRKSRHRCGHPPASRRRPATACRCAAPRR